MWRWPPSRAVSRASRRSRSQAPGPEDTRQRDAAVEREVVREPDVLARAAAELALEQVTARDHPGRGRAGGVASGEAMRTRRARAAVRGQRRPQPGHVEELERQASPEFYAPASRVSSPKG